VNPEDPVGSGARRAVHQMVPALIARDATGNHALLLRDALRAAGWRSEIYSYATHDELLDEAVSIGDYPAQARPDDVLVYQFSTSSPVAGFLATRDEPLIVNYHNVTGPEHFAAWEPETAARATQALAELALLAPRAALGLADSAFNERDLLAFGCPATTVVPPLFDPDRVSVAPDHRVAHRLQAARDAGGSDWLCVGRLVPSKAPHQAVKALWAYHRRYDPSARLHLVGAASTNTYVRALRDFIADLSLTGSVRITGEVSDHALAAYYAAADVVVSTSLHEGFGIPLVEAMGAGVPVVALGAGAVADTVGGAGLVLDRADPSLIAAAVHRILVDDGLRAALVASGHRRAAELGLARSAPRAVAAVAAVAGPPPAGPPVPTPAGTGRGAGTG
jgi:glycosyltransferase involved in cell wall biosynthesis